MAKSTEKIPCPKCDGRGIIPQYYYNRKGICFMCWGAKYVIVKIPAGRNKEDYIKELIKNNKPDFKKNPAKAELPAVENIKNPTYFPTANSQLKKMTPLEAEELVGKIISAYAKDDSKTADDWKDLLKRVKALPDYPDKAEDIKLIEETIKMLEPEEEVKIDEAGIRKRTREMFGTSSNEGIEAAIKREEKRIATSGDDKRIVAMSKVRIDELKKMLEERETEEAERRKKEEQQKQIEESVRQRINQLYANASLESLKAALTDYEGKLRNADADRVRAYEVAIEELKKLIAKKEEEESKKKPETPELTLSATFETLEIYRGNHTKTGKPFHVVKPNVELTKDQYKKFMEDMKSIGGRYDRVAKGMIFYKGNPLPEIQKLYPKRNTPGTENEKPEETKTEYTPLPDFSKFPEDTSLREVRKIYTELATERQKDLAALYELMDHARESLPEEWVDDATYVAQSSIAALEVDEYNEVVKQSGLQSVDVAMRKGDLAKWDKLLMLLDKPEYAKNGYIQKRKQELAMSYKVRKQKQDEEDMVEAILPKDEDGYRGPDSLSLDQLTKALAVIMNDWPEGELKDEYLPKVESWINKKLKTKPRDEAMAKAKEMDKKLAEKRAKIVENVSFKDTPLANKIKAIRGKGVTSSKQAQEIGKLVSEQMTKEIEKLGFNYTEYAKSYKEYRDLGVKMDALQDEYNVLTRRRWDKRISEDKRFAASERLIQVNKEMAAARDKLNQQRLTMADEGRRLKDIKQQAYRNTMDQIREMGGSFDFDVDTSVKGTDEVNRRFQEETAPIFPKEWIEVSNTTKMKLYGPPKDGRGYHRPEGKKHVVEENKKTGEFEVSSPSAGGISVLPQYQKWSGRESVYVHEMQHRMEAVHPVLKNLMRDFYIEKVTNSKGKINAAKHLGSGYGKDEKFRQPGTGQWINDYMGKNYNTAALINSFMSKDKKLDMDPKDNNAWEIGTMSLEMIVFDMYTDKRRLEFFQPDVYEFMLGVMAGV